MNRPQQCVCIVCGTPNSSLTLGDGSVRSNGAGGTHHQQPASCCCCCCSCTSSGGTGLSICTQFGCNQRTGCASNSSSSSNGIRSWWLPRRMMFRVTLVVLCVAFAAILTTSASFIMTSVAVGKYAPLLSFTFPCVRSCCTQDASDCLGVSGGLCTLHAHRHDQRAIFVCTPEYWKMAWQE